MNLLELKHVTKEYKGFRLSDISLTLPKGFIMGYVGRNGAGKTTTINLITRICKQTSGEITVNGITYEEDPIGYIEQIGYIGDESYFPADMTVKDIKYIMKDSYKTFEKEKFDQYISKWELPLKKKIETFSRGMKVKLMFACALSRKTSILVLDEATNGLDPVMRAEILELLQDYIADGERSILFSTHMLSDLEQIADYIIFIDNGKIIVDDTKDDLLESYIKIKGRKENLTDSLKRRCIGINEQEFGFDALISSEDAGILSNQLVIEKPNIDQIMLYMLRGKEGAYESI